MSAAIPVQKGTMPEPGRQRSRLKAGLGRRIRGILFIQTAIAMFMDGWIMGHLIRRKYRWKDLTDAQGQASWQVF